MPDATTGVPGSAAVRDQILPSAFNGARLPRRAVAARRHPHESSAGRVSADTQPDDPPIEWLQRAVVVRVAVIVGELGDHLVKAGHRSARNLTSASEHRPAHALRATGRGERAVVGVKRVHADRTPARQADPPNAAEQFGRAGFTNVYLFA